MITYAFLTKEGDREQNEDAIGIADVDLNHKLFILADGLGAHSGGKEASNIVKEVAQNTYTHYYQNPDCLELCFQQCQRALMERQAMGTLDLKSTLCLLEIREGQIRWGHVGDSRIYTFHDNKLTGRTIDHSVPQMLYMMGELKEEEIRFHPDRNKLLKVMGTNWEEDQVSLENPIVKVTGDAFLMCTDGFWELVDEYEMMYSLSKAKDASQWLRSMEQYLLKNGRKYDKDNYSAIAIKIG